MLNQRTQFLLPIAITILLSACSDQQSEPKQTAQINPKANTSNPAAVNQPAASVSSPAPANLSESIQEANRLPTRNELQVLTAEAKLDEDKIQQVMELVNENLTDQTTRKQAEEKLKALLPDYKEKMLLIAKAKMKEEQK